MTGFAWKYMARFRCTGGDCPDTCCASWGIEVAPPTVEAVRERWGEARADIAFQPYPAPHQRPDCWGRIRMGEDSRCPLLTAEGRCGVQVELGEPLIPQTCASYPRSLSRRADGSAELAGFLSCPEAARLALLARDAFDRVDLAPLLSPQQRLNTDQTIDHAGPYFDLLGEVREALFALGRDRPLTERLWLLARLSAASAARFSRPAVDPAPLRDLLSTYADPHYQEALLHERPLTPRPAFVSAFAEQLRFLAEGNPVRYPRPRRLLWRALQRPPTPWAPLEAALQGPLDNYLAYHLLARWYTEAADLGQHIERLLLKLALIRVLLTRRPPEQTPEDALVDAAYAVDRLVEHDAWIFSCKVALRRTGGSHHDLLGDLIAVAATP